MVTCPVRGGASVTSLVGNAQVQRHVDSLKLYIQHIVKRKKCKQNVNTIKPFITCNMSPSRHLRRSERRRFMDSFSLQGNNVREQRRRPQTCPCSLRTVDPQVDLVPRCCCHRHPAWRQVRRMANPRGHETGEDKIYVKLLKWRTAG